MPGTVLALYVLRSPLVTTTTSLIYGAAVAQEDGVRTRGHTDRKWWTWASKSGHLTLRPSLLHATQRMEPWDELLKGKWLRLKRRMYSKA